MSSTSTSTQSVTDSVSSSTTSSSVSTSGTSTTSGTSSSTSATSSGDSARETGSSSSASLSTTAISTSTTTSSSLSSSSSGSSSVLSSSSSSSLSSATPSISSSSVIPTSTSSSASSSSATSTSTSSTTKTTHSSSASSSSHTLTVTPTSSLPTISSSSIFEPAPTVITVSPGDESDPSGNTANASGAVRANNGGKIAGGIVGSIGGALVLLLLAMLLLRCRRKKITNRRTANIRVIKRNGNGDSWFGDFPRGDVEATGDVNEKRGMENMAGIGGAMNVVNPPHLSVGLSNQPVDWTLHRATTGSLFSGGMPPPPPVSAQPRAPRESVPPSYKPRESSSPNSSAPFITSWSQQYSPHDDMSEPHGDQVGSPVLPEIVVNSPGEQVLPKCWTLLERCRPPHLSPSDIYTAITTPTTLRAFDTHTPSPSSTQSTFHANTPMANNPFRKSTQTLWSQTSEDSRYSVPSPATNPSLYHQYSSPPVPPLPVHVQLEGAWNGMPESPMYSPSPNFPQLITPAMSGRSMRGSVVTTGSRFSIGESPIEPPVSGKRRLW
ncbi:hypothetical protein QCA50_013189 [Cerrena zonata]|uniref:Uncharacterized protein n=1 Tax=Cerrena zonata TaxID=2478898 RepID=A0AAW0FQ49_9APHY